jgi:Methyltransferase FkbM domain
MNVAQADDNSSLLPVADEMVGWSAGARTVANETVALRRLDEVLNAEDIVRPALLKLDVQGHEMPALQGCGTLLDLIDLVLVEVSFLPLYHGQALADEIVQFLFARHFSMAGVSDPAFDAQGRCLQADFLFSRAGEGLATRPPQFPTVSAQ